MILIKDNDRPIELIQADEMLKTLKRLPEGIYNIKPSQIPIIKTWWDELHNYTGADFSFNDNYTKLIKR